jgi:hypothetical protein
MRTFKPNPKFLADLHERVNASIHRDLIRPQVDRIVLGPGEPLDRGFCTHCEAEDLAVGFLLPGYGYVCNHCGVYLVVKGLRSYITQLEERLVNSTPVESPSVFGPPAGDPDPSQINAVPQPGFEKITVGPAITPSPAPTPKTASILKTNHGETTLNVQQSAPGEHIPSLAKPPLQLNQMRAYNTVPAGTVMRVPIKPLRPEAPETPINADTYHDGHSDSVQPTNVRYRKVSGDGLRPEGASIDGTEPIGHVINLPEVDISTLSPEEQETFKGYNPGKFVFTSAYDVARYEQTHGDPQIMALLQEIDDSDEELVATEEAIRRGRKMRGMPESNAYNRGADGVFHVSTQDPKAAIARLEQESGRPQFAPLTPIED